MSNINQIASDLYKAVSESDERKVKPYDVKATVLREEGNIVWVKIPGGVDETPVQKTNNANVGDDVMVRIAGGRAWLLGNETSPATDDTVANAATQIAEGAGNLAKTAADSALEAQQNAQIAYNYADQAHDAAEEAVEDARTAFNAANSAQIQLSIIEDVAGTLSWIESHGSYKQTTDTSVQEGTVYFVYNSVIGDYVPIATPDPTKNPAEEGWYILDITDSQTDYIMSHLAVTSRGLWVLPSGKGDATEEQYALDYKVLLASDGLYIYDGDGELVSTFGENIKFSSTRNQRIGGDDGYIEFNHTTGELTIGGSKVIFQPLTELRDEYETTIEGDVYYQYTTGGTTYDVWHDAEEDKYYYYNASGEKTEVSYASLDRDGEEVISFRKGGLSDRAANAESTISNLSTTVSSQAVDISALHTQADGNARNIASQAADIARLQTGQSDINTAITATNVNIVNLDNRIAVLERGVVIDPQEPSVTVVSQSGAVKVTDGRVTIKGAGNTVSWADDESFNAKRLVSSDIRPRYMKFEGDTVTLAGSYTILGRSNGHLSVVKTLT